MAGLMSGERVATRSTGAIPLNELVSGGARQAPDIDAFATKGEREAAIMLWNYHDDDAPAPDAEVKVTVAGIPSGVKRILLEDYRIDETHSNAYTVWKAIGSPQSPTPGQYAKLKAAGQLQLLTSPDWLDVSEGEVAITTSLPRQATSLMHLEW